MKKILLLIPFLILIGCKVEDDITVNIPCPDIPTVAYAGQVYNTVQIGNQCWMAKNMNVGTMIYSDTAVGCQQANDGIIEKYCFNNDTSQCDIYGGLYEWGEAMQYNSTEGAQGICPNGWHIPSDGEWCILAKSLDNIANCGKYDFRSSLIAGGRMKEAGIMHWCNPNEGATNESGFTALPGGFRDGNNGNFGELGYWGDFWSSSQFSEDYQAFSWSLQNSVAYLNHGYEWEAHGVSVRCIKDD